MTELKPNEIPIEDRVFFEVHNRDGRMGKRIVEAILSIRSIVSWGCEKIFDRPSTKEAEWPKGRNFVLLLLEYTDSEDAPINKNKIFNFKDSDTYKSRWKGEIKEGKQGNTYQVPILIWKKNIYALAFKNSNKWICFLDFEDSKHYIKNSEMLKHDSSYVKAGAPNEIGPQILINAIKNLSVNHVDRLTCRRFMFDICLHFLESCRNTQIQDVVEKSFEFAETDTDWMNHSTCLESNYAKKINAWQKMSSSLTQTYLGAGWDARGTMAHLDINTVDKCESILGVVKYEIFSKNDLEKHKNDCLTKKEKQSTRSDRGGPFFKGERGESSGDGGHEKKEDVISRDGGHENKNNVILSKKKRGKDVMSRDFLIYKCQASAREQFAAPNCKVEVVANPVNTNTLITKEFAPSILEKNISSANHSSSKYQDVNHTTVKSESGEKVVGDDAWLNGNFINAIQQRGAAIIKARKLSSSLFAASSACNFIHDWVFGNPEELVHCFGDIISRMVQSGSKEISESIDKIQSLSWSKSFPFWYLTSSKLSDALELNALGEFSSEQIGDFYEVPRDEEWEKLWSRCELADIIYQINKRAYDIKRPTANLFLTHLQEIPAYIGQESTNSIAAFLDPRFRMNFVEFCLCDESRATFVIRNICKLNDDGCTTQFDGKNYLLGNPNPDSKSNFNSDSDYEIDENEDQEAEGEEDTEADGRDEDDERTENRAKETCVNMLGKLNVVHEYYQSTQSMYHKSQKTDLVHLDVYLAEAVLPWVQGFSVLHWWKDNCSSMARDFLAIPTPVATSDEAYCTEPREANGTLLSLKPS